MGRLTAEAPDTPGTLSRLSQAPQAGGNIIALGTFSGETIASTLLTIKVEGIEEQNLKKALEPQVLEPLTCACLSNKNRKKARCKPALAEL